MELHAALQKKIIEFLSALPEINHERGQKKLLDAAALDDALRKALPTGKAAAFFVPLLVKKIAESGRLKDGRHPLEAVLNAANTLADAKKQKDYVKLLEQVHALAQEQQEESAPQPQQAAPKSLRRAYVHLCFDQASQHIEQRTRKELPGKLAELLKIDKQFVQILPLSGNEEMILKLQEELASKLVIWFQANDKKFMSLCQQFSVTAVTMLNPAREIALLSDTKLLPEARQFIEQFLQQHPQILDRRNQISATQIKGLENVLLSADTTQLLHAYIQRQKLKAKRNENPHIKNKEYYLARFYEQLEQKVNELELYVGQQHGRVFPDAGIPALAQSYHYHLVKEFLQHLIIDYTFRVQSY